MTKLPHLKHGGRCVYCDRRTQSPERKKTKVSATRDHVTPKSQGGRAWVLACLQCNGLKGDLSPAQWATFMHMHPFWWRTFTTNAEVKAALLAIELRAATIVDRWCVTPDQEQENAQVHAEPGNCLEGIGEKSYVTLTSWRQEKDA